MDAFWDGILSATSDTSDTPNTLQRNFFGVDRPMGGEESICNGKVVSLASLTSLGVQSERLAIQQEDNEISSLPDKPALSLADCFAAWESLPQRLLAKVITANPALRRTA